MEHQWIQCYIEWNPIEVNVIEWDISGFNVIFSVTPLNTLFFNGTSMNSMLCLMKTH